MLAEIPKKHLSLEGTVGSSWLEFDEGRTEYKHVVDAGQSLLVEVRVCLLPVVVVSRGVTQVNAALETRVAGDGRLSQLERLVEGAAGQVEQEGILLILVN